MKAPSLRFLGVNAAAGKHGFEFTEADYELVKKEAIEKQESGELDDLDLEMVAGGKPETGAGVYFVAGYIDEDPANPSFEIGFCLFRRVW
jgi:hypothetical protein